MTFAGFEYMKWALALRLLRKDDPPEALEDALQQIDRIRFALTSKELAAVEAQA